MAISMETTIGGGPSFNWHDRSYGYGTIFEIAPTGTLSTLHNFCSQNGCPDGAFPTGLVQGVDRNFYGVTSQGGISTNPSCTSYTGCGTVFRLTPTGVLTTIYSFCSLPNCADGAGWVSTGALIQGADGNFYGTMPLGGVMGWGTIFKITPAGQLTTLYSFCSAVNCEDGEIPNSGLVQGANGDFYGTTSSGGSPFWYAGTVFRLKADGTFTTLYRFCNESECSDGAHPNTPLVVGKDGNLYGTTAGRGRGTIFKISPTGDFTHLYQFGTVEGDGTTPQGLLQGSDGNFYGTTAGNGCFTPCPDDGTVFQLTPEGQFTTIYSFVGSPGAYGAHPLAGLVQGTDGTLYGTTYLTTENKGNGVVFSLAAGLAPFVETNPASGIVGRTIGILGNYLKSTKTVSFNGTPAKAFTIVSDSLIEAPVPVGATTGYVTVTTSGGTLTSNVPFQVIR